MLSTQNNSRKRANRRPAVAHARQPNDPARLAPPREGAPYSRAGKTCSKPTVYFWSLIRLGCGLRERWIARTRSLPVLGPAATRRLPAAAEPLPKLCVRFNFFWLRLFRFLKSPIIPAMQDAWLNPKIVEADQCRVSYHRSPGAGTAWR